MTDRKRNGDHDYEMNLLEWIVIEPFNGATDYNVVAAFEMESDAERYADYLNEKHPVPATGFPFETKHVGTGYGKP